MREGRGRRGRERKGEISEGGTETTGIQGGTGIFSSRCIDARKNGVKAPLSLPSATTPRTTSIPPCPLCQPRRGARSRWTQQRGEGRAGSQQRQRRAGEGGFERTGDIPISRGKPARLPDSPACSLARLSARRLPSHRPKAGPRYTEWHTDDRNRIESPGLSVRSIFISG